MALIHAYAFFVITYFNYYENLCNSYKTRSFLLFLQNILQVIIPLFLILFINKNSYYERVLGSSGGLFIVAIVLFFAVLRHQRLVNITFYRYALIISLPSVLTSVSSLAMQNCDHIMITSMCGAEYTAVYGFMYNIGNVILIILTGVSGPVTAWIYNALDKKKVKAAIIGQKWYFLFFILIITIILMFFPEFIKLVVSDSYWDFRYIAPFVLGSSLAIVNTLHGDIITFYKKTGRISLCVGIAAICNLLLNYYFIKKFGAIAAAYTSFVSYLLQAILYRIVLKGIRKNIFSDFYSLLYLATVIFLSFSFIVLCDHMILRYLIYSVVLSILIIKIIINRKEIEILIKA